MKKKATTGKKVTRPPQPDQTIANSNAESFSFTDESKSKQAIVDVLNAFASTDANLLETSIALFEALGYHSDKRIRLKPNTAKGFVANFADGHTFDQEKSFSSDWKSIDFLFQLTDDEVRRSASAQQMLFESAREYDGRIIESYLFFALDLKEKRYTRTQLSNITRAINRLFPMPVMLLFRHGETISVSIIKRRLHKRDTGKDVLEKVTLIKDIDFADPLRAHVEILHDISLPKLYEEFRFHNFVGLHDAWARKLDSYDLNKQFYLDIAVWYAWASSHKAVVLPRTIEEIKADDPFEDRKKQRSIFFIRLLTRLIFCWFLQEKRLIPRELFRPRVVGELLKDSSLDAGTFYRAVLQNLFFATLNVPIENRKFIPASYKGKNTFHEETYVFRYADLFSDQPRFEAIVNRIPFVNGGLFDCLDLRKKRPEVLLDGFSQHPSNELHLPNELFFGKKDPNEPEDLSEWFHDARFKNAKVRGLIEILSRYKFTVEENTPLEQEIALDPELLGKVFENLLASYNDDTETTARKKLGAFYTPREIVNYMVDQSLRSYLATTVSNLTEPQLDALFDTDVSQYKVREHFKSAKSHEIVSAIGNVKILDPACGSGAFPMGALHRLVDLLKKLDPRNETWKKGWLDVANKNLELLLATKATKEQLKDAEDRIADITQSFDSDRHDLDFARKLHLIENCIYGVDIQPIACQIAKLRFFIALIVDQHPDPMAENMGVRPLPNLETKIVAANALIPIDKPQRSLFDDQVRPLREKLEKVRHDHFSARTPRTKSKCREEDERLRSEISVMLEDSGMPSESASRLSAWDPYDQSHAAPFFDSEWMFGIPIGAISKEPSSTLRGNFAFVNTVGGQMEFPDSESTESGFDIVLANPPYVRQEKIKDLKAAMKPHYPNTFTGTADLYVYFYDRAMQLLRKGGCLSFITSNKWFRAAYGEKLRDYLSKQASILHLIDFGDAPVFEAIAYPTIVIAQKKQPSKTHAIQTLNWEPTTPKTAIADFDKIYRSQSASMKQNVLSRDSWQFIAVGERNLLDRIRAAGAPLGEVVNGKIYRGILTGLNEAFVVDRETRDRLIDEDPKSSEILKPFVRGRNVKRWRLQTDDLWLIAIQSSSNSKNAWAGNAPDIAEKKFRKCFPSVAEWLLKFGTRLEDRQDKGKYPWELRSCDYMPAFEGSKILYPDIYEHQSFVWDTSGTYAANTCYFVPTSEQWITPLLNSPLVEWFYSKISNSVRGGYLRAFTDYITRIPVCKIEEHAKSCLKLVMDNVQWLSLTGGIEPIPRDVLMLGYFEQLLNGLVYELYFGDELHQAGLWIFDLVIKAKLPAIETIPETQRLKRLREIFETIYHLDHPIRGALFSLQSLETVRIIEGKA